VAAFNFHRRRTRRGWYAGATLAVAVFFAVFFVVGASANLSGSTFEGNDGNLVVNTPANTDWANVAGLNTGIDKPPGSTDNSFGQGTKEDNAAVTVVSGSIPPNKNDLTRFYEASEQAAGNGDIFLYLGWERLVNIGNANLDFEINQNTTANFNTNTTGLVNLARTAGDLLVTYDFGGSGTPTLGLNTWLTAQAGNTVDQCFSANALPCWGKHVTLKGTNSEGAVNTTGITDPLQNPAASLGAGLFGEAAIDLTAAGVFPQGSCEAFGSAFLKSRSSSSFTAEIKDFVAPVPVNVSNCGSITIHKVTENGDSSFGYTTTGGLSPSTFSLSNGGTQAYTKVTAGGYSVSENLTSTQIAAGWTLKSLTCLPPTGSGTSVSISGSTVNITEGNGGVVDCTYTNHINKSPTIATTLSGTTVNIGDSVHDSASLSGNTSNAGGTVTYHAYAGANTCSGTDLLNSTVNVNNGSVPDSAAISFNTAGVYSFQAVYSGDGNNNPATSVCSTEQLVVKTNPGITTALSGSPVNTGDLVHDSATLSGATSNAGGTVTYHAYAGANTCSGTDLLNSTVTVNNGNVPDSASTSFNTPGTYSFQAVYSGDGNNNGATSTCSTEQLVVKTNPGITTTLSKNPVNIGESMHDSATLTGATSNAGGTVTYHAYAGANTCSGTDLLNSTVTVNNGNVPDSATISFNAAGVYSFQAVYSGDGSNNGATSTCSSEQLLVKANPKIATQLSATSVDVGSTVHDSATLSGQTANAGGTVTYTVYIDPGCLLGARDAGTVNVNNGSVPDSNPLTFNNAGTFYWQAAYSGDANNNPDTSPCTSEQLAVNKKHPGASTAQNLIPNDSFTLTGGFNPTGSITFNLFGPGDPGCNGTPALTQTVNVNGNSTYSTTNNAFIASDEGTWRWRSTYSGDGNNFPAVSSCGTEQFTIANH
jgi:hypothetical protein